MADTFAPILTGLTLPPVSVSDGAATFTFGASATDQGDGVARVQLTLDHPLISNGGAISTITFNTWDGAASSSVTLPIDAGTLAGTYVITQAIVTDAANNSTSYTASGLQSSGIASSFVVQSNSPTDTTGPTLISIASSTSGAGGSAVQSLSVGAADGGSGVRQVVIHLDHALQTTNGPLDTLVLADTNDSYFDGSSSVSISLAANAAPGAYAFTSVDVTDKAGNVTSLSGAALTNYAAAHPGVATSLFVADTTAPVLTSITLPTTIDVSHGNVDASFSAIAHEDVGVREISLEFGSAFNVVTAYGYVGYSNPGRYDIRGDTDFIGLVSPLPPNYSTVATYSLSGDEYSVVQPITSFTPSGTYTLTRATATDTSGNKTVYEGAALAALGPTSVTVIGDDAAPHLTGITMNDMVVAPSSFGPYISLGIDTDEFASGLQIVAATFDKPVRKQVDGTYTDTIRYDGISTYSSSAHSTTLTSDYLYTPGVYHLTGLTLTDALGHTTDYTGQQLAAMGFDTDVAIGRFTAGDFNVDARADVLWVHRNGAVSTWSANETGGLNQSTWNGAIDPSWHAVETFDQNYDGRADILWRSDTGGIAIWRATAGGFTQTYYNDTVGPNWRIAATGNYGYGAEGILWQNTDGSLALWQPSGTSFLLSPWSHGPVGGGWQIEGTFRFTGAGTDDLLWFNPGTGELSVWTGGIQPDANGNVSSSNYGFIERGVIAGGVANGWHVAGLGDFNGDEKEDILWRHDNGSVSVWTSTGTGFNQSQFNAYAAPGWSVAEVGDFNGDGMADLLWRHSNGTISMWQSTGTGWAQNTYSDGSVGNDWTIAGHVFP